MCSHVNRITFYGGDSVECFVGRTEEWTDSLPRRTVRQTLLTDEYHSVECCDWTEGRIPYQINQQTNIIRRLRRNILSDAVDNPYDHNQIQKTE